MSAPEAKAVALKPLCPYCSAPWTDDMVRVEASIASHGCDTCGHGARVEGSVDIECSTCKKLIYRKEF